MKRTSMPKIKKLRGFLLLLLGGATGILAQIVLFESQKGDWAAYFNVSQWQEKIWNNTSPIPGIGLYLLAGIFFILGLHGLNDSASFLQIKPIDHSQHKPNFAVWTTSLGLAAIIAFYASRANGNDPYGYFFSAAWIISIALLVISVLVDIHWRLPLPSVILVWVKTHHSELILVTIIVTAAFVIRLLDVEFHPYSFINDEGLMGSGGECFPRGECTHFFSLGWADQSRLAFFPYTISIGLFGRTALAVRLVSVITGTLSVLAAYLFAREVFDKKTAWLSATILSTLPVHVHFSRTGVDNIVDSLTAPLVLWLLFRGIKRGSTLSFLAAGIAAGLCIYTYPGSLLACVLAISLVGYVALSKPGFLKTYSRNIIIFVLAGMVVTLPIIGFYSSHSNLFLSRMKSEGILEKDRLGSQAENTRVSAAEILANQFAKSSLVFIATSAPVNFFNSPKAYLPGTAAVIFILGMAYTLWRIKDLRYTVVFVWFWAVVVLGSTLTGGPPTSQRMLMSMPALVMIIAIGITKTFGAVQKFYRPAARFTPIILLGLMLYIGYRNVEYYFYEYRIGHYYEEPSNELTYETSAYIAPLQDKGRMYLIANPIVPYLSFGSFKYFSPEVEKANLNNITHEIIVNLPRDKDILFIALPDYIPDLELIRQWVPGGTWTEFKRRYQPEKILFYSYKITKDQLAAIAP